MSKNTARLCGYLLAEHFGNFVEKVGLVLLNRGRSSLREIDQKAKISLRLVRESLFVLLQHNLVTFWEHTEGSRLVPYYQLEVQNVLMLDRYPTYIKVVMDQYGEEAADIVAETLRQGRINMEHIKQWKGWSDNPKEAEMYPVKQAISELIDNRFMTIVSFLDAHSRNDRHMADTKEAFAKAGLNPNASDKKKINIQLADKWQEEDGDYVEAQTGEKRKRAMVVKDFEGNKRHAGDANDVFAAGNSYRVNFERFHIYLRTDDVAKFAAQRINPAAGAIMKNFLRRAEDRPALCKTQTETEFVRSVKPPDDVELLVEGDAGANRLLEYMEWLADGSEGFLKKKGELYCCPIRDVVTRLKQQVIESIIVERFSEDHKRIWRILLMKEKLDEKQVAKFAMVPIKEARRCLFDLHNAGFAFIQDVPRTADHATTKTFFLFYICIRTTSHQLVESGYRTLANLKQRRAKEIFARKLLLEKSERTDVVDGEGSLSVGELRQLDILGEVIKRLRSSEMRMDRMMLIFRDY
ncbi:DNA-directed RNA polymerase III subunit RPC3 [Rhizophlyctis rosea]|uniref:DNA-directed RNA polymerase III subunit RPC3 n=1 Tax=Rhizophlyctis rosea TaxID=64517 RepID=A0AAD5SLF2_9FUNG|nr:DNA-directed RNA polymerase III subunit RPC3 [Rhizophlyctis rosea]